jgi:hypothetical protein
MKLKRRIIPVGKKACKACLAGKMREILSKKTRRRETIPGRGLHFDITGRIGTSIRGYNYYLLGVDDVTCYTWVALLKTLNTDEVLPCIKEIVARIQNFTGNNVAWIRADNGKGEFAANFRMNRYPGALSSSPAHYTSTRTIM